MDRHTPGPWTADRSETEPYSFIEGANGHLIASVHLGDHPDSGTESGENEHRANARLIAASPKVADALADARELLLVLNAEGDPGRWSRAWAEEAFPEVLERASEALEEAAGPDWWKHLGEL